MNTDDKPCQVTPSADLRQQIMDSRVPKNEREWWAQRTIEKLETDLARLRAEVERLKELLRIESSSAQHALAWAERDEADAARLDWLLDHGAQTYHSNPRAGVNYVQYHKDRAAIDAAMTP